MASGESVAQELERGADIAARLLTFASRCLVVAKQISRDVIGKHVMQQLVRSATGAGANYEEARGAESRSDFIHKIGIALKEAREARFWLQICEQAKLVTTSQQSLIAEALELCAILGASKKTAIEQNSEKGALARARSR